MCLCVSCMHACLDCESRIAILMQRMFIPECDQVWMESGNVQVIGGLDSIAIRSHVMCDARRGEGGCGCTC